MMLSLRIAFVGNDFALDLYCKIQKGVLLNSSPDGNGTQHLQVVTGHPVLLYSLPVDGNMVSCVSLDNFFPSAGGLGYWMPTFSALTLTGKHADKVLVHEKKVKVNTNNCS